LFRVKGVCRDEDLAVDDDIFILELLPIILAQAGITDVTVASSAQDALSAISNQAEPFECFLLDVQMPGGSGIELCGAIRDLPDLPVNGCYIYHKTDYRL